MLRRAMVAPVVKDTIEWKVTWMETRKAVCIWKEPVPQTDTGGWVEHTKAIGSTMVKELGKTAP